jgi:hypothetical protein
MNHGIWADDDTMPELASNSGRDSSDSHGFNWRSTGPNSFQFGNAFSNNHASAASPERHDSPQPTISGLGGIFGMIQSALGGQAQQPASTNTGPGTRSYQWQSPSGNAHFSMTTSTTTFPPRNGRPMTPEVPNLNQLAFSSILLPPLNFTDEDDSFLNDMFAAPISPGGTPGMPPGMGPPRGAGMPGDPITLLDILLGGRFGGAPGEYAHSPEDFDRIISEIMERTQAGTGAPAATEDAIASLPKKKADEAMLGDTGKAECTICMAEVTTGEVVTELYCKHWFHTDCIKSWLEQHNTCPHCRKSVEEAKEAFEKNQRDLSQTDGSASRSRGGDNESDRKRVRRSRSSNRDNNRSNSTSSRDLPRTPGAWAGNYTPQSLRLPSFSARDSPRNAGINPRNIPSSFRTSTPPVAGTTTLQPPTREVHRSESDSQIPTNRMTRMRDSLLASRRPASPTHPTVSPVSPPRRSRSGDPRTLYASRNDHITVDDAARRSSRTNPRDTSYDHRDYAPRRRSHEVEAPRRRHTTYDERAPEPEEHTGLIARARGWLSR